jgi:hypothetical protein
LPHFCSADLTLETYLLLHPFPASYLIFAPHFLTLLILNALSFQASYLIFALLFAVPIFVYVFVCGNNSAGSDAVKAAADVAKGSGRDKRSDSASSSGSGSGDAGDHATRQSSHSAAAGNVHFMPLYTSAYMRAQFTGAEEMESVPAIMGDSYVDTYRALNGGFHDDANDRFNGSGGAGSGGAVGDAGVAHDAVAAAAARRSFIDAFAAQGMDEYETAAAAFETNVAVPWYRVLAPWTA